MIAMITGAVLGLCFFVGGLWAYRRGIKDGLAMSKGNDLPPIDTPIEAIQKRVESHQQAKEAKEQQDSMTDGIMNILAYDGTPQKVGDK